MKLVGLAATVSRTSDATKGIYEETEGSVRERRASAMR